jgi:predicted dehydrogenase
VSHLGNQTVVRRDVIKKSGVLGTAALLTATGRLWAGGSDKIRLGLIGCGGRGTYDTPNCLNAAPNVELVAMGDLFRDRLERCRRQLTAKLGDKIKVTDETCFTGWDAHKKVLATDVNLVILTEPPYFRPSHLRAALEAGKHVFMEKPVAVDPVGVRSVIESSRLADEKGLTIVAGTQGRRMVHLIEGMKRIHNGDIGEIVAGQCIRIGDGMLTWSPETRQRQPGWSDMEWQLRRWLFLTWLSGDFIVEMHIHNLDRVNWAMNAHPVQCMGLGGRQARTDPEYGDVYDHFAVEYEYPNGARSRTWAQIDKASELQSYRIVGTRPGLHGLGQPHDRRRVQIRRSAAESRDPAACGSDRGDSRRAASQRRRAGGREHDDVHHGPDERLYRTGPEVGLGHAGVQARPASAPRGVRRLAGQTRGRARSDTARLTPDCGQEEDKTSVLGGIANAWGLGS